jgi:ankyrin repeat protein
MPNFLRSLLAVAALVVALPALAGAYDDILVAARNGDTAKVVELLQRGMDVNTSDRNGDTLTAIAARSGNNELLDFLAKNRANLSKRNKYGDSPIMQATMQGYTEIVKRLLDAGADIGNKGWNPLHYAAYTGRADIARLLIERGADLDSLAPNGQTALMLAAGAGHLEVVKLLIEADADMDVEDTAGNTAISLAERHGRAEVADYLRNEGAIE